jgi:methionyl-tRNA synthetase
MQTSFYITTPIYYVNDEPHLGHAYTTILSDVLARYARLAGTDTFFLTGVDEHGQKVYDAVRKAEIADAQAYVDRMAARFQATWANLRISNDDFIRTTEPRHVAVVQAVLQDLWERDEIYRGEYAGWYCVPDERFWTEKDLNEGLCPECGRPVERIVEANYFFRMSKYQDWLVEYLQAHPDFIQPQHRRSEVLGFLRQPLADLCISRPVSRLNWGIRLPFDPDYVTYVWFDALLNYVTAAGYLKDQVRFDALWPQAVHFIGKDILTTHSVYWLTMLKAMGVALPKNIFAHGWWVIDGRKMGKSLGNAIKPLDLSGIYGVDAFRYFLLRDMTPGQDADFDEERLAARYSSDLANNLGNLLHRVVNMTSRYFDGIVPSPGPESEEEQVLRTQAEGLAAKVFEQVDQFAVNAALAQVMDLLTAANGYLERTAPWKEAKSGSLEKVGTILYSAAEVLRLAGVLLTPVMPERSAELFRRLGWQPVGPLKDSLRWGVLAPGGRVEPGEPLFPRVETGINQP